MIGNLTIDKASMNISYFLYSIKLIYDNGGRMKRGDFVREMAAFIGLPPVTDDGKENRTPYNKSKLPRYFGFIDVNKDEDNKDILVLTNRGLKVISLINIKNDEGAEHKYGIKDSKKDAFVDLIFESVIFDTFGGNHVPHIRRSTRTDDEPSPFLLT